MREQKRKSRKSLSLKVCPLCGEDFMGFHDQKYCTIKCTRRANYEKRMDWAFSVRHVMRPVSDASLAEFRIPDGFGGWMSGNDARVM